MKKILFLAAMAAMFLFVGCKEKQSEFNRALNEDYAAVVAEYPEAMLYEVETQFNDVFNTRDRKNLHVVTAREVFQVADTLVMFIDRNFDQGSVEKSLVPGAWLEDVVIRNVETLCDVNEALDALFKADIITPDSNLMTLRNPLGPKVFVNPFYIFGGTKSGFVAVDARTLEVQEFE